ncbi:MAG: hypothetical protein GY839_21125 [candidate division Zixibacteria bacterium]|nr:hypothetical protein [candidate division Zixibacteria bacterium]
MLRKFIRIIFTVSILYFIVGLIIAELSLIPIFTYEVYLKFAAMIGGVASVFGLLALALPIISSDDLKTLEISSLKNIASLAEEMQEADKEIDKKSREINKLNVEQKQIELLVRKASLSLHLQNIYENNNKLLAETYQNNLKIKNQLEALGEEIKDIGNKELLNKITKIVKERELKDNVLDETYQILWMKPSFMGFGIDINALVKRLMDIKKKSK